MLWRRAVPTTRRVRTPRAAVTVERAGGARSATTGLSPIRRSRPHPLHTCRPSGPDFASPTPRSIPTRPPRPAQGSSIAPPQPSPSWDLPTLPRLAPRSHRDRRPGWLSRRCRPARAELSLDRLFADNSRDVETVADQITVPALHPGESVTVTGPTVQVTDCSQLRRHRDDGSRRGHRRERHLHPGSVHPNGASELQHAVLAALWVATLVPAAAVPITLNGDRRTA
jgi:hypothetical protein